MEDKDLKALNEKLMVFAGITYVYQKDDVTKMVSPVSYYLYPDGRKLSKRPYLVNNPTDQLTWLYSKLYNLPESVHGDTSILLEWNSEYRQWYCQINLMDTFEATDKEQPVAFALACGKYIDSLEKKNE